MAQDEQIKSTAEELAKLRKSIGLIFYVIFFIILMILIFLFSGGISLFLD